MEYANTIILYKVINFVLSNKVESVDHHRTRKCFVIYGEKKQNFSFMILMLVATYSILDGFVLGHRLKSKERCCRQANRQLWMDKWMASNWVD